MRWRLEIDTLKDSGRGDAVDNEIRRPITIKDVFRPKGEISVTFNRLLCRATGVGGEIFIFLSLFDLCPRGVRRRVLFRRIQIQTRRSVNRNDISTSFRFWRTALPNGSSFETRSFHKNKYSPSSFTVVFVMGLYWTSWYDSLFCFPLSFSFDSVKSYERNVFKTLDIFVIIRCDVILNFSEN